MMVDYVQGKRGINLNNVTKVNIKRNRLLVYTGDKLAIDEPVEALAGGARAECNVCVDYPGAPADIAVGAVGSSPGGGPGITRSPGGSEIRRGGVGSG